jgi:photosystem II stability/assembly factor-like uncharacterized protein
MINSDGNRGFREGAEMKKNKIIASGGLLLSLVTACNLTSQSSPSLNPLVTQGIPSPTGSLAVGGNTSTTNTQTPLTPTPMPTATVDPLAVPRLQPGTELDILKLEMLDAQNGWGIGGKRASGNANRIFRTKDGGATWVEISPPEPAPAPGAEVSAAAGYFADAQTGWVTYHASIPSGIPENPVVWRTADGGATWQASSALDTSGLMETYSVSHVFFSGASNGWLMVHVGAGMNHDYVAIYRSTDGGASWSRVIDPTIDGGIQSCSKTGLAFWDGSNGWLTGNCNGVRAGAFLYQTADGGAHWSPVNLAAPADHPDLFTADQYACGVHAPFLSGAQAYLGVECADMGNPAAANISYLYRSTAGGAPAPQAYPGGDLFTLDGNRIWALGKEIFRSDTAGVSWTKIATVTWDGQFDFVTGQLGWAAVRKGTEYGLVQTSDGGGLWVQLAPVVAAGP